MHHDRYGLGLTTGSARACESYVRGCELMLTLYPGALEALDQAISEDPRFALAHVAKARALQLHGEILSAQKSLDEARSLVSEGTAREASHFGVFDRLVNHPGPLALDVVLAHVREWLAGHVALVDAVAGDHHAMAARELEMAALAEAGRYPSGSLVPALARGVAAFARADFDAAIGLIEPVLAERERIGGSRAQTDLVEFTLLRAYAAAGRVDAIRGHLERRGARSASIAVAELAGQHHTH